VNIIKNNVLSLINPISSLIPVNLLANLSGQKIILPFYHAISNRDIPHIKHLYPVKSEIEFKKDLDFFLKYYKPISLDELVNIAEGRKKLTSNSFHLSFDDGLKEVYEVVAPILSSKGIPATFFLNSAFVDNKDMFYRYKASLLLESLFKKKYSPEELRNCLSHFKNGKTSNIKDLILSVNFNNKNVLGILGKELKVDFNLYLNQEKPYLTSDQIKELMKKGFTPGAHSIDHPEFSTIKFEDQIDQATKSMKFVSDHFKPRHHVFAFPFTDHGVSKKFFNSIFSSENPPFELTFGTAGIKNDGIQKNMQRIPMEENIQYPAKSIINKQYLYYLCKFPFGKNTIKRQ
jgi:hypothetical protein